MRYLTAHLIVRCIILFTYVVVYINNILCVSYNAVGCLAQFFYVVECLVHFIFVEVDVCGQVHGVFFPVVVDGGSVYR